MRAFTLYAPVVLFTVFAGYMGWRMSQMPTESDLINLAATDYMRAEESRGNTPLKTDCQGRPGADANIKVIVVCQPAHLPNGKVYQYYMDKWGRMDRMSPY